MMHSSQRRYDLIAAAIILLGFALRIYRLDTQALSGDEAFSIINWTRRPLSEVLSTIALIDPQPPATLLSLIGWVRLVGDSVFAARMLSVLSSTLTLALTYNLTRQHTSPRTALTATAMLTLTPFHIYYAQDVRSYSLWMAASALALFALINALRKPRRLRRWLAYALATALSIYMFYLELFFLLAQYLYILWRYRRNRTLLLQWGASQAAIALILAPWFLQPTLRNSGYEPTASAANLPWAYSTLLLGETIPAALNTPFATIGTQTLTPVSMAALILTGVAVITTLRLQTPRRGALLILYAIAPTIMLGLLAAITGKGYFRPRYVAASSTPLVILVATALDSHLRRRQPPQRGRGVAIARRATTSLAIAALLIVNTGTAAAYYFHTQKAPPWPEIAELLRRQVAQDEIIIRNYPDPAFDYYYTGPAPDTLLPTYASSTRSATHTQLQQVLNEHTYAWFMPVEGTSYDPEQIVAEWLWENAQLISNQTVNQTRILQFAMPITDAVPTSHPTQISIRDAAYVIGYRTTPPERIAPGETLFVEVFWQPLRATEADMLTFVNLYKCCGNIEENYLAMDEQRPQNGRSTTLTWAPGTVFREVYELPLPPTATPGTYELRVGLSAPATDTPQLPADSASLGTITMSK